MRLRFAFLVVLALLGLVWGANQAVMGAGKTVELSIFIDHPQFREIYSNYFNQFVKKYQA
jgi:endo-1,4-beta-mannosidase